MASLEEVTVKVKTGVIQIRKMYKDSGVLKYEDAEEELVEVRMPTPDVLMGSVTSTQGVTINTGDFNSAKIGISVTLPCVPEELEDAFKAAKHFCDMKLATQSKQIHDWLDERKKGDSE